MYYSTIFPSPIGRITLASDGINLVGLWMEGQKYFGDTVSEAVSEMVPDKSGLPVFKGTKRWLDAYFEGKRPAISDLPLAPNGREFRQAVWDILCEIPYGEVITYGEIARKIAARRNKATMSAQAVGGAVGHNPISIIIPCHRVVGAGGSLTGYAGGIAKKIQLLELEGVDMSRLFVPKKSRLPDCGTMNTNDKSLYAAFKAHDSRFDGRFFVGVSSTGIYCRPVCRAKFPLERNCTFYPSAAAAELAGYRPCLTCRPELAPGHPHSDSNVDSASRLAVRAAAIIEENRLVESNLSELAQSLGITDRHLRRVFAAEFGVSPVQYLQTCRLLLAKNLLTDTSLSVTQVAMSSGFGSVRRFNDLFKTHYKLTPTALRKNGVRTKNTEHAGITIRLGYRPPYRWDRLLGFLGDRALPGVESVKDGSYRRTVMLEQNEKIVHGWIAVRNLPDKNSLAATLSPSLIAVLPKVISRIRHLFDLNCEPSEIDKGLECMNRLKPGLYVPGIRLPGCFDPFEMSVRAVLGQQITVKAARTLALRFAESFGERIETPFEELSVIFPATRKIVALGKPIEDKLGPLGITGTRARSIVALAAAVESGNIHLSPQSDPETEVSKLLELPGIGPWTAKYIAMRILAWPDAFPHTDYGVKKALGDLSEREILRLSEAWKPWRAYATVNLWECSDF